jgi:nucleotide-binding universal stress UspA family protein
VFKHLLISTDGSPLANKAAKAGIALAHALGAKITAYYAAEQLQPIYGDGYMLNQKMIDGFEERAREVGQKRVDAIGKMAKGESSTRLRNRDTAMIRDCSSTL